MEGQNDQPDNQGQRQRRNSEGDIRRFNIFGIGQEQVVNNGNNGEEEIQEVRGQAGNPVPGDKPGMSRGTDQISKIELTINVREHNHTKFVNSVSATVLEDPAKGLQDSNVSKRLFSVFILTTGLVGFYTITKYVIDNVKSLLAFSTDNEKP